MPTSRLPELATYLIGAPPNYHSKSVKRVLLFARALPSEREYLSPFRRPEGLAYQYRFHSHFVLIYVSRDISAGAAPLGQCAGEVCVNFLLISIHRVEKPTRSAVVAAARTHSGLVNSPSPIEKNPIFMRLCR
jgi:hypothetical protein